jgi:hypothetical protein
MVIIGILGLLHHHSLAASLNLVFIIVIAVIFEGIAPLNVGTVIVMDSYLGLVVVIKFPDYCAVDSFSWGAQWLRNCKID